jgi:hypothetical protein
VKRRPDPEDEADKDIMAAIDEHGWAVRFVWDDNGEDPNFHYSAGIYERCGRPELLVFGLSREVGQWVVNEYGQRSSDGEVFEPGTAYEGFLEGHCVVFLAVDSRRASIDHAYTTWTDWYYERNGFPLLQLVWPDPDTDAFPWQADFRDALRTLQPLLGDPPQVH